MARATPPARRALQSSLAATRAGWELTLQASGMGFWEWDVAAGRSHWSARSFELFGLEPTPDGTVDHDVLRARIHPDDAPKLDELLRHVLRTGEPFTYEYRIVRPDGAVRSIAGRGRRVDDPVTGAVRMIGVGWDVTADREHGHALESASEQARVNLELLNGAERAAQVGAFLDRVHEADGACLLWSDTTYQIFACPRDRPLVRATMLSFFWPGHAAMLRRRFRELRDGGESFEIELPLRPAPGRARWVRLYLHAHRDPAGRCVEISGAVQDISDRKRLECELAAAASEERRRIGSDLHDDLGQTLTGLGLQLSAVAAKVARGRTETVAADLARLERLVATARESCRRLARAYVAPVTRESLLDLLHRLGNDAGPSPVVMLDLPNAVPAWLSDESAQELFRIAQEALTNAAKHSRARVVRLVLGDVDDGLELSVHDDGRGFELSGASGGVGLASLRHRAARIGAFLRIESTPGRGTCIRVLVPDAVMDAAAELEPRPHPAPPDAAVGSPRSELVPALARAAGRGAHRRRR